MVKKKKAEPMTEEEKIAFEEQKRLAEEEIRKKREDVLAQFLKDKINKEEKAAKYNINRICYQWRAVMRELKSKDLIKDIEVLSQTFERVIDSKDAVIKSLVTDLTEAEEQYALVLRNHIQNVDFLIELQKKRLAALTHGYATELQIVCEEFDLERAMLIEQHFNEMNDIADILFAMEESFQERENEAKGDFTSMRDEIKNKNLEDKHALRVQLENKIEDLWQQFKQALNNYNETNEERKTSFENLKIKDEKNTREIELQMRKLQRISDQISHIRAKMSANAKESEEKNKALKEEREKMQIHFHELRQEMNRVRERERAKLVKLVFQTDTSLKQLKKKKEKGELILKMTEMCRKLETEEEKVLPFHASSITNEEQQDLNAAMMEKPFYPMTELMHESSGLENFWKRYNKVLLDKLSLDKEKSNLTQENQRLRKMLKQYLDGISVNEEVLSHVNPLLVVNNRSNVRFNVPVTDPRIKRPAHPTVVEAAHAVKHILK